MNNEATSIQLSNPVFIAAVAVSVFVEAPKPGAEGLLSLGTSQKPLEPILSASHTELKPSQHREVSSMTSSGLLLSQEGQAQTLVITSNFCAEAEWHPRKPLSSR